MIAGLVIGGFSLFLGFGTPQFWAILGLGAGLFFHGLAKFVRVGGLKGELARERALHHDV